MPLRFLLEGKGRVSPPCPVRADQPPALFLPERIRRMMPVTVMTITPIASSSDVSTPPLTASESWPAEAAPATVMAVRPAATCLTCLGRLKRIVMLLVGDTTSPLDHEADRP